MEAVKIVTQLADKTDSISFFGKVHEVTVRRGVWQEVTEKGALGMLINGVSIRPDKLLFAAGEPTLGDRCKHILLHRSGEQFLSIGTDARVYILGTDGKTIEVIY